MVVSPKNLWADYNRSEMPLDVTEICTFETPFGKEKHVYFNGETTAVGCTRIYARALLSSCNNDKIIIVMLSPEQDISSTDFLPLLEKGWSVLAVDYAGNAFARERFTIYPNVLSFANYDSSLLYEPAPTPQKSCQYVWTTVCLRSITFAESEGFSRIALLGEGIGGAQIFRSAAVCDFPVCAVSLYSPGFYPPSDDPDSGSLSIALDVPGYAPLLRVPFLQLCCSNDSDSSLDNICYLNEQSAGKSALYIAPRADRSLSAEIRENLDLFLSEYLDKDNPSDLYDFAPSPVLTANGAENKLYFSLKCTHPVAETFLFVSHGVTNSSFRNWRILSLEKSGENEFLGFTEVYSYDKPVYSFACIRTNDGFLCSSPVIKKIPSMLNVTPTTISKRRLIYDSDMGIDDFFTEDGSLPHIKTGPFDIGGICAEKALCTYKIGDVSYSGDRDGVLQLLLFSPVKQSICFSVTDEEQFLTYTCTKTVSPEGDWTKLSLSVSDFKSNEGSFFGWDKAIFMKIEAEEEILINSLLWV